jgi:hypothetical protein
MPTNIVKYNGFRWAVFAPTEMKGLDRLNYMQNIRTHYAAIKVGEITEGGEEFPVKLSCGYYLSSVTPNLVSVNLMSCMAYPSGLYIGHANGRYILSGFAFGEIFGFIKEWNRNFKNTSFIVRKKVGLEFYKAVNWWSETMRESSSPEIFFVSIEVKNIWNNRFMVKLLCTFLRAFFYGEAAGGTLKLQEETYIDYFLRIVNAYEGASHYYDFPLKGEYLNKIDSLEKIPPFSNRDIGSQTYLLGRIIKE